MTPPKPKRLTREEYLEERKELYKYQQAAWDAFEKTLVGLSGSFLAFSIGFLGFLAKDKRVGEAVFVPGTGSYIVAAWVAFAVALSVLTLCYLVNIRAYTFEIIRVEDARQDASVLDRRNLWGALARLMYGFATVAFLLGILFLILFCTHNFSI